MSSRIHFITGKGGVGKSTIAASMAMAFAEKGKKTLLVETSSQNYFRNTLSWELKYSETEIHKNFYACQYLYKDCLKEYLGHLFKLTMLANALLNNPVTQTLINTAPALPSLAVLGKLTSGIRNMGLKLDFEEVVVDSPSSGHFLSMIEGLQGLTKTFRKGPLHNQANEILQILKNNLLTKVYVVLNPEQLTAIEAFELADKITEKLNLKSEIILNKFLNFSLIKKSEVVDDFTNFLFFRQQIQSKILTELKLQKIIWNAPLELNSKNEIDKIEKLSKVIPC